MAAAKFVLTENERIATSTIYRDGVLICRPMGLLRGHSSFEQRTSRQPRALLEVQAACQSRATPHHNAMGAETPSEPSRNPTPGLAEPPDHRQSRDARRTVDSGSLVRRRE